MPGTEIFAITSYLSVSTDAKENSFDHELAQSYGEFWPDITVLSENKRCSNQPNPNKASNELTLPKLTTHEQNLPNPTTIDTQ